MKKLIIALAMVIGIAGLVMAQHNGPYPNSGGSGGGGGGGNTYIITNQVTGVMAGYGGGFTNQWINSELLFQGTTNVYPIYGPQFSVSTLAFNSAPVQAGTYTNFQFNLVQQAGLGGTTNITFTVFTNGVSAGIAMTVTTNEPLTNFTTYLTVGNGATVAFFVTNNSTAGAAIGPIAVYWSIGMQVPTSVVSVSNTTTIVATATNADNLLVSGTPVPGSGFVNGVINVLTNGFTIPGGGFVSVNGAGAALQAAISWSTNLGGGIFHIDKGSGDDQGDPNNPVIFSSNNWCATIVLQPNIIYYNPPGYVFPNNWGNGSFRLTGSPLAGSIISGDSNVVFMVQTNNGLSNVLPNYFEMDHLTIAWSNNSSRAIAVSSGGIGNPAFYNCIWQPLNALTMSNVYLNWDSGQALSQSETPCGPNGIIGLLADAGGTGGGIIRDCYFNNCALGLWIVSEHWQVENCGFQNPSGGGGYPWAPGSVPSGTNMWASNDVSYYTFKNTTGNRVSIRGADLAPNFDVIIGFHGGSQPGDILFLKDDFYVGQEMNVGLLAAGSQIYHNVSFDNCHAESSPYGIVFLNDASVLLEATTHNCSANNGQNKPFSWQIWQQNSDFTLTPAGVNDTNSVFDDSYQISTNANATFVAHPIFQFHVNNQSIVHVDTNGVGLDYGTFTGNGGGISNVQGSNLVYTTSTFTMTSGKYWYTNQIPFGRYQIQSINLICVNNDAATGYTTSYGPISLDNLIQGNSITASSAGVWAMIQNGTNLIVGLANNPGVGGNWELLCPNSNPPNSDAVPPTSFLNFQIQVNLIQ